MVRKVLCVFGQHNYGDARRGEGYEYTNFLPAWKNLATEVAFFESFDRSAYADFSAFNRAFLECVERERPEAIFFVLMGYELWSETVLWLKQHSPAVLIHWGTDDSWKFDEFSRFIAPWFHLHATTSGEALRKAHRLGYENVALSQWAASERGLHAPKMAHECDYAVSFIGSAYGNRPRWIEALRRRGIEVNCFGHGWPSGPIASDEIPRIVRSSIVSLNFGDSGLLWRGWRLVRNRQIKARVFEVTGAGGFLLTEPADALAEYFALDREIVCFSDIDELAAKIRYYLDHPEERNRIAWAGYERTRNEHTYEQRFRHLLQAAQQRAQLESDRHDRSWRIDWPNFEVGTQRHTLTPMGLSIRNVLVAIFSLFLGKRRGARAARRALFEVSWRIFGAATYSAAGLPGRLFFRES